MAEKPAQSSDQKTPKQLFLPHQVKIMKVALALVILRQKPSDVSALEFTKRLALQFSHLQTNWKNKSDQLERELLRTRQELIKCQISSELSTTSNQFLPSPFGTLPPHVAPSTVSGVNFNFNPSNSTSFGINPSSSQQQQSRLPLSQLQIGNALSHHSQLFEFSSSQSSDGEWQSSGYCSSFPAQKENKSKRLALSDGGSCDVVMVDESQSCTEEGDGSNEMFAREAVANRKFDHDCDHDGGVGDSDLQEKIATHIKFCKSVSSLAKTSQYLSTLVTTDLRETLHDTILDSLKTLTDCFDPSNRHLPPSLPLSKKVLDESMSSLVESIQNPLLDVFKDEMVASCNSLVKAVIHRALHPETNAEMVETLSGVVVKLCQIRSTCQCSVELLIYQVTDSAKLLTKALSDCSLLTSEGIEVAAVKFKLLESLLTTYNISAIISDDRRHQLIQDLEDSALELSETFPLFLYSIWKVMGYLS